MSKQAIERALYKGALAKRIKELETMISNNQHEAKVLAELRKEYREIMDELDSYYDDDPEEQLITNIYPHFGRK